MINLCYHFPTGRTIVLKFLTPWWLTDSSEMKKKLVLLLIKVDLLKVFGFVCFFLICALFLFLFLFTYVKSCGYWRKPGTFGSILTNVKNGLCSWQWFMLTVKISEGKHKQLKMSLNDFGPNCIYGSTENWLASSDSNIFITIIPLNLISIDVIERMKKEEDNFYPAKDLQFGNVLYFWKPLSRKQIFPSQNYLDKYFLQPK